MQTINNTLKYAIFTGLALITFIPLYVNNSLFFPFISGKGFAFRIIVEIVFALWLILILREKGTSAVNTERSVLPRRNMINVAVSLFTIIALIADLSGLNPLRSIWSNFERMEGWMIIIHLWAYFMVLSSVLNTRKNWYRFFNIIIISALCAAFYGLFQFFGWAEIHQGNRVDASLGNSAYMAIYMLISAFLSGYMALSHSAKRPLVWLYSICAVFFSFIMFQTATRGTIIGWAIAVIVSCIIYTIFGREVKGQSNKSRFISGGIIGLLLILSIIFYFNRSSDFIKKNAVLGRLATISLSDTKTQARGFIWPMAIKGIFENSKSSIIGVGQENFNYIFNSHYDPKMWRHEQWFDRAHSVFLDWLVAGGILGLISYLLLYIISLIYICKSDLSIGEKSVLIGLFVGYGIHNVFVFDNQTSYVMFFTILAFIYSIIPTKALPPFKNYSKIVSEDYITVRDYIFIPLVIILFIVTIYCVNIRPIQANTRLISAMQSCSNINTVSAKYFENVLKLNQTVANQEAREQLIGCAANVIQNQQISSQKKIDFFTLTKAEIENQIKTTPNDARIYIIGGSFFDNVRSLQDATPLLEKANTISPNKQSIIYELVSNYINIGKIKEAASLMEKAYLSAPDNQDAKTNYVSTLIAAGEDDKAHKLFPNDADVWKDQKIINAYMISKEYNKAIALYKDLIKATPDSPELYSSLAYAYLLNKQDSLAIDILKKAEERLPLLKTQVEAVIKQIQEGKFKTP